MVFGLWNQRIRADNRATVVAKATTDNVETTESQLQPLGTVPAVADNGVVAIEKNYDYDENFRISYEGNQIYINGEPSMLSMNSTIAEVIAAQ